MTAVGPLALVAALVGAAPVPVIVDGDVGDVDAVRAAVAAALTSLDQRLAPQVAPAQLQHRLPQIRVRRGFALAAHKAAASTPGIIEVRSLARLDARTHTALAHEAAHQFLWSTCPVAASDALFHEAFAVWASGEAASWLEGEPYLSLPRARDLLLKHALDTTSGRRALARLVVEEPGLPRALRARLRACADGAPVSPLALDDLAAHGASDVDVLLVLQRATGEAVVVRGDVDRPLPYGSTLKPLVVAAARMAGKRGPKLVPRATDPSWACELPPGLRAVDETTALLLSCNGWFLDWAARDADVARLGELGPVLLDAGLSAIPDDMAQAIGVRATGTLSPRGLALAYRALSWARPDVVELLRDNAVRGTLAGAAGLRGVAAKTGTVRGLGSAPELGWLVAVTDDVVVVRARSGVTPEALVDDVAAQVAAVPRAARTVAVQTFGLLPSDQIMARCDRGGFTVGATGATTAGAVASPLASLTRGGAAICREPWLVTLDDQRTRPYGGVFTWQPPDDDAPAPHPEATARQRRARRGADFVFFTSLGRYTAGVLQAEDGAATGAAREALGRVVAHNVLHAEERHGGRPLCDTTHCQVFPGSAAPPVGEAALRPLGSKTFLQFSKGGVQPWRAARPLAQWHAALRAHGNVEGVEARLLGVRDGRVTLLVRTPAGDGEEALQIACEPLRNTLRLPSCPGSIVVEGLQVRFTGQGEGHGAGLDVEQAKESAEAGQSADEILRAAYGPGILLSRDASASVRP